MARCKALFIADWIDAAFVHFRIDPKKLQPLIPLSLDTFNGDAYISLVAFTQRNLRPMIGGALAAWLATPLATHEFLNVRTYVRHGDTRGIFFLAEWIPNRLACLIGPRTYGLPYRWGLLDYSPTARAVSEGVSHLKFEMHPDDAESEFCVPGSLDHFLLERYTAFTHRNRVIRRFDVDHTPWPMRRANARMNESSLLLRCGDWIRDARLVAAHLSPGVRDVAISPPRRITDPPAPRSRAGSGSGRAEKSPASGSPR